MNNNFETLFEQTKIICYKNCKCCNNIDFISKNIILNKCWEPNISSLFLYLLKDKDDNVVFDIGCNIGYYSLISSKYSKSIFAFDANINNIELLNKSIQLNNFNNITTVCCALTDDENKKYKIGIIHEHNIGSVQVVEVTDTNSNIQSIKIDNFIETNKIKNIDLMKIDIEGSELLCLKGMQKSLENHIIKNIIIEVTPSWDLQIAKNILNYLHNNEYKLFDIGLDETGTYSDKYQFEQILKNPITNIDTYITEKIIQTNILAKKLL